jgi:phage repressor protein C with HTH and peptisase S24 domain
VAYNLSSDTRVVFCEPLSQPTGMTSLGKRIQQARKRQRLTQEVLAKRLKVATAAVGQWETDATQPDPKRLPELAKQLGETIDYLMTGVRVHKPESGSVEVSEPVDLPALTNLPKLLDVPVFGTVLGGRESDFLILDEIIEYRGRMPGIMGKRRVYGLYVQGDSMAPWAESGDMLFVDPDVPASIGDYIVFELKPVRDGDGRQAFVKRLVGRSPTKLKVKQWNPEKIIEFDRDRIAAVHRVLNNKDLSG